MTIPEPGQQLASIVCDTRVVVVRHDGGTAPLTCGGEPMVPLDQAPSSPSGLQEGNEGPTVIGKRYLDAAGTVEVLCTKAGAGGLAIGGERLEPRTAKPLPSSD